MPLGEVFIREAPNVELDAYGALLIYTSGGETYYRRHPMGVWEAFLQREIVRLAEYRRQNERKVLLFPSCEGCSKGHH